MLSKKPPTRCIALSMNMLQKACDTEATDLEDTMDEIDRRSYDLTDNQWAIA